MREKSSGNGPARAWICRLFSVGAALNRKYVVEELRFLPMGPGGVALCPVMLFDGLDFNEPGC